jgi:SPP1 gp7 family putative phage head morphogenesis protein
MEKEFSAEFMADIIAGIWSGAIGEDDLPENLYYKIAEKLKEKLYEGYGGSLQDFEIDSNDYELLDELRDSIYHFSAAKTANQVRDMTDALTDEDGTIRSFSAFKKAADEIFTTYNENYLRTEYNTALASGQMGVIWNKIEGQKKILPYLKMSVVEDDVTSDICEPLDGITLPVDDPFWDEYYPPNHWNCRSTVEQLDEEEGKSDESGSDDVEQAVKHAEGHMQDKFKMNVGKDRTVFSPDHPYFDIRKDDPE